VEGMDSEKKKKGKQEAIYLRNYSKAIFLFPLLITSFILWILEFYLGEPGKPIAWLGFFWTLIFFINVITIAFDISSTKFFTLVLVIVIIVILLIFFVVPSTLSVIFSEIGIFEFNIGMTAEFYFVMTTILVVTLLLVFVGTRFDYWRMERNEIYHKKGIFVTADRYPTKGLRVKKTIPDVVEFFILRAGSLTLLFGNDDTFHLDTILNINKKSKMIDSLLSDIEVEIELPSKKEEP
jgi:magnesium-transporting ATPase (P-type)